MANNKGKVDQIHDLLPKHFNSKNNENWAALVEALGGADQNIAELISEVRKQFFVKTASRPYLDKLAANNKIARPKLVGMDDTSFRQYIPVLSYQPKQVKLIIDQLLDVFFFKESTTAFTTSSNFQPFAINDGWELDILVDEQYSDRVIFKASDFQSINSSTADEAIAAINRQTKYCYAVAYNDSSTQNVFIRIFTKTIGAKGSIRITGGRANIAFRFNGFISSAGNGSNTEWTITKVGDEVTFKNTGGTYPGIQNLQLGDIAIIDLPGNVGSFPIKEINLADSSFTVINLFGTPSQSATASLNSNTFTANNPGLAGNSIALVFDGLTLISSVVATWNSGNPLNTVSYTGADNIPSAQTVTLSGGTVTTQTSDLQVKFIQDIKNAIFLNPKRAAVWETSPDKIVVELPASPPVVRRSLKGSIHINGAVSQMVSKDSDTQLTVADAFKFPESGSFFIEAVEEMLTKISTISENTVISKKCNTRLQGSPQRYSYSSRLALNTTGDIVTGQSVITNLASMTNIAVGQRVVMSGLPDHAMVKSIFGNTVTVSSSATVSSTGASIKFLGNTLTGITPVLPTVASLNEFQISSLYRSSSIVYATTTTSHNFTVGDTVIIEGALGGSNDWDGSYIILSINGSDFTYKQFGVNSAASTFGSSRVERFGLASSGSRVISIDSIDAKVSRINGPYMWDSNASFVLSYKSGVSSEAVQAGKIVRLLNIGTNNLPSDGGYVIFNYGLDNQEGPVRFLYKPNDNVLAIDPSYTFKKTHSIGSSIRMISKRGPHVLSSNGSEYAGYITDPSEARVILQELITSVKSAGIFVDFLIRYPEQLYGTLDVYNEQGLGAGSTFK